MTAPKTVNTKRLEQDYSALVMDKNEVHRDYKLAQRRADIEVRAHSSTATIQFWKDETDRLRDQYLKLCRKCSEMKAVLDVLREGQANGKLVVVSE